MVNSPGPRGPGDANSGPSVRTQSRWFVGECGRVLLELENQREYDRDIELGPNLWGRLEAWRMCSAIVDGFVETGVGARQIEIHKSIAKRRFSVSGTEITYSPEHPDSRTCDAEIAAVSVGPTAPWRPAFAAFGSPPNHHASVLGTWRGLVTAAPAPSESFAPARSMGYPAWLDGTFAPHDARGTRAAGVPT